MKSLVAALALMGAFAACSGGSPSTHRAPIPARVLHSYAYRLARADAKDCGGHVTWDAPFSVLIADCKRGMDGR